MIFSAILTRERRSVKRTELDQSWSMNAPCSRETVWEKSTFWWTMCSKSVWALMNQSARFVIFRHKVNSANSISVQLAGLFGAPLYACFKYFRQKRFLNAILQCPQELNEIVSKWFGGQMIRIRFEMCIQMLMERWKLLNLRVTATSKSVSDHPFDTLSPHSTPHNHYKTNFEKHVFSIFLVWCGCMPRDRKNARIVPW